jgi:heme/copper-type cytochrome/quinol oxidase subunit 2
MKIKQTPSQENNPWSVRRHQKEALWQITLPLISGVVVLLLIAVFSARMSLDDTRIWADISIIWLIIPIMVVMLIWLITLAVSIYAVYKVNKMLPAQSCRLLKVLWQIQVRLEKMSDRSVEPILNMKAFTASAKRFLHLLSRSDHR